MIEAIHFRVERGVVSVPGEQQLGGQDDAGGHQGRRPVDSAQPAADQVQQVAAGVTEPGPLGRAGHRYRLAAETAHGEMGCCGCGCLPGGYSVIKA